MRLHMPKSCGGSFLPSFLPCSLVLASSTALMEWILRKEQGRGHEDWESASKSASESSRDEELEPEEEDRSVRLAFAARLGKKEILLQTGNDLYNT